MIVVNKIRIFVFALCFILFHSTITPIFCQAPWPTKKWPRSTPEAVGCGKIRPALFEKWKMGEPAGSAGLVGCGIFFCGVLLSSKSII